MTLAIRCENPAYHKNLRVKGELAGKRIKCPACGGTILVPRPTAVQPGQGTRGQFTHLHSPAVLAAVGRADEPGALPTAASDAGLKEMIEMGRSSNRDRFPPELSCVPF